MRQVFTLWPTDSANLAGQGLDSAGMPLWSRRSGQVMRPVRWTRADGFMIAIVTALVAALALIVPVDLVSTIAALALAILAIGLAVAGLLHHRRTVTALHLRLEENRRWNETIFNRTGIALWREDWSVARDEVLRLLQDGVRDMQGYFAAHPDELRALRKAVIIKDVNSFALLRAGATDKTELTGSLDRILPDTDQTFVQWLVAFARGDSVYRSETHLTDANGNAVDTLFTAGLPTDMRGFEDILVSDLDITEYKATQERLAKAELDVARAARVTTMGALSASIAHEVNSPLAAIISNAEASMRWIRRERPDVEEAAVALRNVVDAASRAKAVVERTRAFLSNSPGTMERHDVARLIQEAILLIERELRASGVSIHIDATPGLPPVMADAVNIQQVIVNLALNAAQAMRDLDGPRDVKIAAWLDEGRVQVSVRDHGHGIDKETQKSIFDPFFSTKPGGMGMRLAICRTCIASHGGRLWVNSRPGDGAIFRFDLQTAPDPDEDHTLV
ncbi:ATP-binding protein [Sphingomonas crocodyli]|uniref:histidine kinase n=1 Tax=Sphingomonas crocodyli TaxID=1979270 RepID=A0A437M044_9SPHN|nr:ATP-binding protein [Sphingomonas crocodyli]RVT90946.1 hypothetical protein EOD43_15535 [Sphingomonas crocodyli]